MSAIRRLADWDATRLRDLAAEHGTPLYVLDLDRVRANLARLTAAFTDVEVAYAVKANTTRPVLETVAAAGHGAECASAGEVDRALAAGFDPADVRYTAVNPPAGDLDHVLELAAGTDLVVTAGAADTVDRLAARGYDGQVCLRVNPGVGAGHHEKVRTGADPTFGIPADRLAAVARTARSAGLSLVGLHAHAGSGITSEAGFAAHRELVGRMADHARAVGDLRFVNVGGGIGVPYRPTDPPVDLDALAAATRSAFDVEGVRLGIEPGRYVVADAGVLLTTVNTVKQTESVLVAGVDAGMTTLIRPALYDAYHELRNLAPDVAGREATSVTVAGPVCETADVLCRERDLPRPRREDVLAVGNAGAYGYEMASQYNSRPRPAVVAREGDETRLAVRRESMGDLTRLEEPW